jgi:hypothetical protein
MASQTNQPTSKPSQEGNTTPLPISSSSPLSPALAKPDQTNPPPTGPDRAAIHSSRARRNPGGKRERTAAGRPAAEGNSQQLPKSPGRKRRGDGAGYSQALRFLLLHQGDAGNNDITLRVLPSSFS